MIRVSNFFLVGIVFFLFSCGYNFERSTLATQYQTISVPFIEGDSDGDLTSATIEEISQSGYFTYCPSGGLLTLNIKIIDLSDENIGFRYDRKKKGRLRKSIIPVETRFNVLAEVVLAESATGKTILGPARIGASIDFDHDYYSSRKAVNIFSLGQLSDYDAACDAVYRPLNRALAQKIMDFINDSW